MQATLIFLVLLPLISAIDFETVIREEWHQFKTEHGKFYPDEETENFRMQVFMNNKHYIAKHNQLADKNMKSYRLKMNKFGDLLHQEFRAMMNGYRTHPYRENGKHFAAPEDFLLPKSVDWRSKGYVTDVKNQEQCGSCWAFSTTGSLEGQYFKKTGKLVSFSEQQLVDCSGSYGNNGCGGGLMDNAFKYIKDKGIESEQDYPYTAQDGNCNYDSSKVVTKCTGFVDIPTKDEEKLAQAVATVGPVSVAIDAGHLSFQFYSTGVYYEPECSETTLDHGVLAVGFDEDQGQKYWIVKNSWGAGWGQDGYIFMSRGRNNNCGIATMASYPTL